MASPDPAPFLAALPVQWSAGTLLPDAKPALARLAETWRAAAGDRTFPGRAQFGPAQLRPVLPNAHVYQVVSRDPPRFVIRLVGTRMTEHIGRNLAGRAVEEIPVEGLREATAALLNAVLAAEDFIHVRAPRALALPEGTKQSLEAIWLPCAEDGGTIDRVIAVSLIDEVG